METVVYLSLLRDISVVILFLKKIMKYKCWSAIFKDIMIGDCNTYSIAQCYLVREHCTFLTSFILYNIQAHIKKFILTQSSLKYIHIQEPIFPYHNLPTVIISMTHIIFNVKKLVILKSRYITTRAPISALSSLLDILWRLTSFSPIEKK